MSPNVSRWCARSAVTDLNIEPLLKRYNRLLHTCTNTRTSCTHTPHTHTHSHTIHAHTGKIGIWSSCSPACISTPAWPSWRSAQACHAWSIYIAAKHAQWTHRQDRIVLFRCRRPRSQAIDFSKQRSRRISTPTPLSVRVEDRKVSLCLFCALSTRTPKHCPGCRESRSCPACDPDNGLRTTPPYDNDMRMITTKDIHKNHNDIRMVTTTWIYGNHKDINTNTTTCIYDNPQRHAYDVCRC